MKREIRVSLLGEYGVRNYGNEASLAHTLRIVQSVEHARPTVICHEPAVVTAMHGVPAWPFVARHPHSWGTRLIYKFQDFLRAGAQVARSDVIIVPGSGVFDLEWAGPGEVPLIMFTYSFWAAVLRRPFLVLSVGADGRGAGIGAALARFAVRRASVLTARDDASAAVLSGQRSSPVQSIADGVFGDEFPGASEPSADRDALVVGLGLFDYYGVNGRRSPDRAQRERFISRLAEIARGLTERSAEVVLLRGEDSDQSVIDELLESLGADVTVRVADARTEAELVREIQRMDVLAACRYHNLIAGALQRTPMIGIGWLKHKSLVAQLGRPDCYFDIGDFEPADVLARIDRDLTAEPVDREELDARVRDLTSRTRAQDAWLVRILDRRALSRRGLRRQFVPLPQAADGRVGARAR
ncbi:polysaccharide pyruvyl transferase family protein [Gryllotalpicola kribbensis]|uniref:Polysaccharide pyruvyl transferase family protein n=1 Tax=Gryllotalpicola kribbensis TaxID=993084 RepID=A0ABP8AVT1_9MICO